MSFLLISVVNGVGCESINEDNILTYKKILVLVLRSPAYSCGFDRSPLISLPRTAMDSLARSTLLISKRTDVASPDIETRCSRNGLCCGVLACKGFTGQACLYQAREKYHQSDIALYPHCPTVPVMTWRSAQRVARYSQSWVVRSLSCFFRMPHRPTVCLGVMSLMTSSCG